MSSTKTTLAARLRGEVLDPIKQRLVGKEQIIEVLGVSLVAGENTFLYGPPGTAKSALVHELAARLGGRSFDYLLTRFTEPSELFGPFDLRRLREGDLVTNTEGMLPEAEFVFLDELLNANSAVLNSLLLALNERIFRRGRERTVLPMLIAIGASNRLPEDEALVALFDRFLLRVACDNVGTDRLGEVLDAGWRREQIKPPPSNFTMDEARSMQSLVKQVNLSPSRQAYLRLVEQLRDAGIVISDRRAVRLQRVIAASAVVCGRDHSDVTDLWIMKFIWDVPAQVEMLAAHVDAIVAEFSSTEPITTVHPLASSDAGPDPEQLSATLEQLAANALAASFADSLSLVAARIEWVQNSTARDSLRTRVAELRLMNAASSGSDR